ncbi:MAG: DUF1232 domain-containing protein [Anaerolineaceae bacterium]|jgi:hypothetical protein|nr:DUF1232 domain-containing protein [Anaerolineaceae bacterium]
MTEELKNRDTSKVSEGKKEEKAIVGELVRPQQQQPPQQQYLPSSQSFFFRPLSESGFPTWSVYVLAVLGLIYILNPTMGLIEFLPDNLPIVGNLDEGVAFMMLWAGLVEFFEGRKKNKH